MKSSDVSFLPPSHLLTPTHSIYIHTLDRKNIKIPWKIVAFLWDILLSHSISLWFCYIPTPSSPDDLAAHLSLLWVHKHIQHHIREARVLRLSGWGFLWSRPSNLLLSHVYQTTNRPPHHRHLAVACCGDIIYGLSNHCVTPSTPIPSLFGSVSVCQTENTALMVKVKCLKIISHVRLSSLFFELVFAYISICSCGWYGAQRGWGEWCWWLWLVLDWRRDWRGGLDELHRQFGLIRDIPRWLSELKPDRGTGLSPRGANHLDQSEMTSLDWLEEERVEDDRACL